MIAVGTLCLVVRTAHPEYMGKVCTCVSNARHPLGDYVFEFPNGIQARGNRHNVQPITPPPQDVRTRRPEEISA